MAITATNLDSHASNLNGSSVNTASITPGANKLVIVSVYQKANAGTGGTPTLTTTASKKDTFGFLSRVTGTYDGYVIGQNL